MANKFFSSPKKLITTASVLAVISITAFIFADEGVGSPLQAALILIPFLGALVFYGLGLARMVKTAMKDNGF